MLSLSSTGLPTADSCMNSPNAWNHSNGDKRGLCRVGDGISTRHRVGDGVDQLKSGGIAAKTFSKDASMVSESCRLTNIGKVVFSIDFMPLLEPNNLRLIDLFTS